MDGPRLRYLIHLVHRAPTTMGIVILTTGLLIAQLTQGSQPAPRPVAPPVAPGVAERIALPATPASMPRSMPSATPNTVSNLAGWQLGPDVAVPRFNDMDITPAILHHGATLWMLYSDGTTWHRFRGTSLDDLVEMPPAQYNTPAHPFPKGIATCADDHYWIGGAWSDGHVWYATVHIEFGYFDLGASGAPRCLLEPAQYGSPHYFRRIGLVTSTDDGATWTYAGDIITAPDPPRTSAATGAYFDFGDGDQRLFVDTRGGYFYLYYKTAWCTVSDQAPSEMYSAVRVARSPISAKMAPGSWTKWYNHAWSQPGLGGRDSDVFYGADSVTVTYSAYLHQYVAIGNYPGFLATASALSSQAWSAPRSLSALAAPARLEWYNWAIDPATWDPMTMTGRTFRLYSADAYRSSARMCSTCAPTKYFTITLNAGPPATEYVPPSAYPPVSIPNGLPEWQWDVNLAANAGFEQHTLAPWRPSGPGSAFVETTTAQQGTAALQITGPLTCATQDVPNLLPNRPYVVSAWLAADPGNRATISVSRDRQTGFSPVLTFAAVPATMPSMVSMASALLVPTETHGPFQQVRVPFTVTPSHRSVTVAICSTTAVGSIYADDVHVTIDASGAGGAQMSAQMSAQRAKALLVHV